MFLLYKLLLEIIWPTKCVSCGKSGKLVCDKCFLKIKIEKKASDQKINFIKSLYVATDLDQVVLQRCIYYYKYHGVREVGIYLNEVFGQYLNNLQDNFFDLSCYDGVVCVPLSKRRYRYRGFNQSEILAKYVSHYLEIDFLPNILKRKYSNKNQVDLDPARRLLNVKDKISFSDDYSLKDKTILLIDDIVTTGSTLAECARVLKKHGAKRVDGLVLAKKSGLK